MSNSVNTQFKKKTSREWEKHYNGCLWETQMMSTGPRDMRYEFYTSGSLTGPSSGLYKNCITESKYLIIIIIVER